jgi:hypothetical protein
VSYTCIEFIAGAKTVAKLLARLGNLAKFNHVHKMMFKASIRSKSLQGKRFLSIDLSEIG